MCRGRLAQSPAKASKSSTPTRHLRALLSARLEEPEVAALVGAENFLRVELGVTALRRRPGYFTAAARALSSASSTADRCARSLTDRRMRSPLRTSAERAARRRVRRDVQHDGAEGGAAHARVGDAHHVLDAGAARASSGSADSRPPACAYGDMRPGVLQHQDIVRRRRRASGSSMRAARSSSEENTTARPSCSNSLASAAERLRIAPLRRQRCRTARPARPAARAARRARR